MARSGSDIGGRSEGTNSIKSMSEAYSKLLLLAVQGEGRMPLSSAVVTLLHVMMQSEPFGGLCFPGGRRRIGNDGSGK